MATRALTVYYDADSGELQKIQWSPQFVRESRLMKLDIIGDVLRELQPVYDHVLENWEAELLAQSQYEDGKVRPTRG